MKMERDYAESPSMAEALFPSVYELPPFPTDLDLTTSFVSAPSFSSDFAAAPQDLSSFHHFHNIYPPQPLHFAHDSLHLSLLTESTRSLHNDNFLSTPSPPNITETAPFHHLLTATDTAPFHHSPNATEATPLCDLQTAAETSPNATGTAPFHHLPNLRSLEQPQRSSSGSSSRAKRRRLDTSRQLIGDKTRSLQKLMPWDKKMDMTTLLEECYKYIKFLQAQVQALQWMPLETSFVSGVGGGEAKMMGLGLLAVLNRQQMLQVVANSPVAQTMFYEKGVCVLSREQLVLLERVKEMKKKNKGFVVQQAFFSGKDIN